VISPALAVAPGMAAAQWEAAPAILPPVFVDAQAEFSQHFNGGI